MTNRQRYKPALRLKVQRRQITQALFNSLLDSVLREAYMWRIADEIFRVRRPYRTGGGA